MVLTKEEATKFFSEFYYGEHHFPGKIKTYGQGWAINHYGQLSSYDFSGLTRLCLMAHRDAIRVEISSSNPNHLKIALHKRNRGKGNMWEKHPTIEEAIETFSKVTDKSKVDTL